MPSGYYMLDVAPNELCLIYGIGCKYHENCFTCPFPDCRKQSSDQTCVRRMVVNETQIEDWLDAPVVKLT